MFWDISFKFDKSVNILSLAKIKNFFQIKNIKIIPKKINF